VGALAIYVGDMPTAAAGTYGVRFFDSNDFIIAQGFIDWDGTAEVTDQTLDALAKLRPTLTEMEASTPLTGVADVSALATAVQVAALPTPLTAAQVNAEVDSALTDYDAATGPELAAAQAAIQSDIASVPTTDISSLATQASVSALPTLADMEGSADLTAVADVSALATSTEIAGLPSPLTGAEVNNEVADALVTFDGATASDLAAARSAVQADIANIPATDLTGIATAADVVQSGAAVIAAFPTPDEMTEAELHAGLDSYTNKDDWKADPTVVDLSAVATQTSVAALQSSVDGLNDITVADIRAELAVELARLDAAVSSSAADVSGLATSSEVSALPTPLTTAEVDSIVEAALADAGLTGLNDLSTSDVVAALTSFDTATTSDVAAVAEAVELLTKYHDNPVRFFGADGVAEVIQADAFFMSVLDDDGSVLKRIGFQSAGGAAVPLVEATRYELA